MRLHMATGMVSYASIAVPTDSLQLRQQALIYSFIHTEGRKDGNSSRPQNSR
jgi:hypothetical protein